VTGAPARRISGAPDPGSAGRSRFVGALPFPPDPFQLQAFDALDAGHSVLVSAPTGSGKTLVAEYAVARALAAGAKAFYTTPLKALSNQKYLELADAHGRTRVGLLTGDTALGASSPVVVMTTEVLRNMLLGGSDLLAGLHTVVLDEVHYLQDPYRGGVWEEVLVLSPPEVRFVCLSATVNNAQELGEWLRSVRGPTEVVVERRRPIVLHHHYALQRRGEPSCELIDLLENGRPSGEGSRIDQAVRRATTGRPVAAWRTGRVPGGRLPFRTPRRTDLVELLDDEDLLPAIVFIFSRAACDDAARQCVNDGLRLTTRDERRAIRARVEAHMAELSDGDLAVLGYAEWTEGLEAGIAAHHAGMVPAFREAVEECFAAGLLKVVFATETLSLGINMPARTVAIERFTKFGSAGRATLTSGEYAQLTGRAGRRGLDEEGHAVVLFSPETTFAEVARVALAPPPDLRSAFRPTYNLAVNLVARFDRPTAVGVLRRSLAQWQYARRAAPGRDTLVEVLGRRLAVLEELGYIDGWRLTPTGTRLSRIYHESDLLVAETVAGEALTGADPSVVAGVLSALVFERGRARQPVGHDPRRPTARRAGPRRTESGPGWGSPAGGGPGGGSPGGGGPGGRRRPGRGDRVGERRRAELAERLRLLGGLAERVRAIEEVHLVPRTRPPEPGLATAVTAWARGASLAQALEVVARDAGEMAPGDFVRTVKQLADLAGQVALVAPDPATAAAAGQVVELVVRDVVAAGGQVTASARAVAPGS
jgi:ATP-dependent RNA helicase HelY